ncbi:MAG: hypothetical protein IIB95_12725 [Candidatus Marinimicrobia bacterium]|nr:hypothetical protein [Candidatus Neomarinimicrobiota bacterium]
MNWLKGLGISVKVAALAFLAVLAVMAAKRQKDIADQWKDKAVDIKLGQVVKGVSTAKAANTQAMIHDSKARQIKKKAETRIDQMGGSHEDVADILRRWS